VNTINHHIAFGFYISRSGSTNIHEYWDNGCPGSFGLISLNYEDKGRCGSISFSNIYNVTANEEFCIRTQYSDGGTSDDTYPEDTGSTVNNSRRMWSVARPVTDLQTWVQLIFEKIN
jgi:hypothetical protein